MIDPLGSSVWSPVVLTVRVTLPDVGMVTVRAPAVTPKSPVTATVTLTSRSADGAGVAVTVNTAGEPSVTVLLLVIDTTGSATVGSSSVTVTDALLGESTV